MELNELGWDGHFERAYKAWLKESMPSKSPMSSVFPARIAHEHRIGYRIWSERSELDAILPSAFKHKASTRADWPAVGDWVIVRESTSRGSIDHMVAAVLPRRTCLRRSTPGLRTEEQVLAANVDTVFVVMGLDEDFNLRRLERYLALVADSGATPVIVLNKLDLCPDVDEHISLVKNAACGIPIHASSATEWVGVDVLRQYLTHGHTVALIGSSGVGKSTLINDLLEEEQQPVGKVRARDGRGQHTTVARDLIRMPTGGLVIDNPGIREIQLAVDEDSVQEAFPDIINLAAECRFSDCTHRHEPGCALRKAVEGGRLEPARLESYLKLCDEIHEYHRLAERRSRSRQSRRKSASRRRR